MNISTSRRQEIVCLGSITQLKISNEKTAKDREVAKRPQTRGTMNISTSRRQEIVCLGSITQLKISNEKTAKDREVAKRPQKTSKE